MNIVESFAVLGLNQMASPQQVRKAYYQLVKQFHPDLHMKNPQTKARAEETTKKLNLAFEMIKKHIENGAASRNTQHQGSAFNRSSAGTHSARTDGWYSQARASRYSTFEDTIVVEEQDEGFMARAKESAFGVLSAVLSFTREKSYIAAACVLVFAVMHKYPSGQGLGLINSFKTVLANLAVSF